MARRPDGNRAEPDDPERINPLERDRSARWPGRVGWLVLIWALSVAGLGLAAWLIRMFMRAAGMTT